LRDHAPKSQAITIPKIDQLILRQSLTAASGLDALTHAVEALTAARSGPLSDVYALRSIGLIIEHLPVAVWDGGNASAREGMALGATLAGMAFNATGTAAVHACGYPLSGRFGLAHGVANALMLPTVVAFNQRLCSKYELLKTALGTADVPEGLRALVESVGLPTRLRDAGVSWDALPELVAIAATDRRHLDANPRPLSVDDLQRLFEEAW
jgi:alcohol dehydrogenase class IV